MIWFSFILALILLFLAARKSLGGSLILSALVLGLLNLDLQTLVKQITHTLADPEMLLLSFIVGLIPIIGGILETTGMLDRLVNNLRMKQKLFFILAPAFMGLLPMPGGALLSAPLVKKGGKNIPPVDKASINIWYRHMLELVYPLGSLIAVTKMAELALYHSILYILPWFFLMLILGYIFFLRNVNGHTEHHPDFDYKKSLLPISIIVSAPLIHIILTYFFPNLISEIPLLIGVSFSLIWSIQASRISKEKLRQTIKTARPTKYALIIIGMFLFLNIFEASPATEAIASLKFSASFLVIWLAFFLGLVTGRVNVPFSILLPIYNAKFGAETLTYPLFAVMYFAAFLGYVISPIHPCISVSLEYFDVKLKSFLKETFWPTAISISLAYLYVAFLLN